MKPCAACACSGWLINYVGAWLSYGILVPCGVCCARGWLNDDGKPLPDLTPIDPLTSTAALQRGER